MAHAASDVADARRLDRSQPVPGIASGWCGCLMERDADAAGLITAIIRLVFGFVIFHADVGERKVLFVQFYRFARPFQ